MKRLGALIGMGLAAALGVSDAQATTVAQLPLSFEANRGQAPARVRYLARGRASSLALGRGSARLALRRGSLTLRAVGGRLGRPIASQPLAGRVNYLVGTDRSRWRTGIETFGRVSYRSVWPGVDLTFHGREGALEYDFELAPGADPRAVALRLAGARSLRLDARGDLHARVGGSSFVVRRPVSYQRGAGGRRTWVRSRFSLAGDAVRVIVGAYDRSRALVIDPKLGYSTYLGGGGQDAGGGIAVDSSGAVYVGGQTVAGFPTTPGSAQPAPGGSTDAFVTKLSPDGGSLVYSTYVGGTGGDVAVALAVDSTGSAYITGQTHPGFPTTAGVVQPLFGGGSDDGFVTKLSPDGGALAYSTYLGGASGSEAGQAIAVDASGSAYLTGVASGTWPTTAGSYQPLPSLSLDGFVTKLTPTGGALAYSTYVGGTTADNARGIAVDGSGAAYITGYTLGGFPTTTGAFQETYAGGNDAFVSKLSAGGDALVYSTYLGGVGLERGLAVAVDGAGEAVVAGGGSAGFPVTPGAFQQTPGGGTDAYVTRLNAAGSGLVGSTFLGGAGDFEEARGIALEPDGTAFVAGSALAGFPTTADGLQRDFGGGSSDAFLSAVSANAGALEYSSYLGGSGDDSATAVAAGGDAAYVTGATSGSLATTAGAFQPGYGGGVQDGFVAKLDFAPPPPAPTPTPTSAPSPAPTPAPTPHAVRGKTFNLQRAGGKVLVRLPGTKTFVDVATVRTIPTGTIVNTSSGRAKLFAADTAGDAGGMDFYDGMFRVTQATAGDPAVTATLVGGDLSGCPKRSPGYKAWARERRTLFGKRVAARSASTALHRTRRTRRKLWGSGKGKFRTVGQGGSAAVRGTRWLTEDGCDGTLVRVAEGIVLVRDKATGSTINVPAGKRVATPFSAATLRRIQRGGTKLGTLTAKGRRKLLG